MGTTPGMSEVRIVDDLIVTNRTHRFNVKGATFKGGSLEFEKGAVLVMALLRDYNAPQGPRTNAECLNPPCRGNTCRDFDGVTHVLQVITNGGTTKDGVNPFNNDQFDLYTITLKNGGQLRRSAFVGLADIDGDDFTDVCLRLNPGEAETLEKLTINCVESNPLQRMALPHGNEQGFSPCTDTQPQWISHLRCPVSPHCR